MRALPTLITIALAALATAAPASAEIDNTAGDPVIVIAGDVTVQPGKVVGDVFIVNGHARILGRAEGDVVVVDGNANVKGRIDGNLVTVAGPARLLPGSSVGGDLTYGDDAPRIARGARVEGEVRNESWSDAIGLYSIVGAFILWLAIGISSAILGLLLLVLAPRAADAVLEQAHDRFWTTVGIGVGILIAVPIAIFIAAVTLVGLPLAIGVGLAALPLAAVAYVTAAWALGRVMVRPPGRRILAFFAGLAVLRVAALVPAIGLLVGLVAVIVGLGLIGAAIGSARDPAVADAPGS